MKNDSTDRTVSRITLQELLLRPYASTSLQRGKYTVTQQPETKKGAGCTESYKLTSA